MEFYRSYYFSYFLHLQDVIVVDTKKCMIPMTVPRLMSTQLKRMLGMCILTFLAKKKKIARYWYVLRLIHCSTNTFLYVGIFPAG